MRISSNKHYDEKNTLTKEPVHYKNKNDSSVIPSEISEGLKNFLVYQKYNHFIWPYWVARYINTSHERIQSLPFWLYNNHCRTWYTINSFLSKGSVRIDPSSMIHPVWARWSVECMMLVDGTIVRFHDEDCIVQENNNGIITTVYSHPAFNYTQTLYLTRTNIDEAVIRIHVNNKKRHNNYCIIAIRPYTTETLSGLHTIELTKNYFIRINDHYHGALLAKPDFVLIGNEMTGDIDFNKKDSKFKVNSDEGMATMAFVYDVAYDLEAGVRLAVNENSKITVPKISVKATQNEYNQYVSVRMDEGAQITLGKKDLNEWIKFCKFSALVESTNYEIQAQSSLALRHHYFTVLALNRMGHFQQSQSITNFIIKTIVVKDDYDSIIHGAYACNIVGDYYRFVRDASFLKDNYSLCKQWAYKIQQYCKGLKNIRKRIHPDNSFQLSDNTLLHVPVLIKALENVAFMSRSLGLFGDETNFLTEANKYQNALMSAVFHITPEKHNEEQLIEWIPKHGKPLRKQRIAVKETLEFDLNFNLLDNRIIQYTSLFYPYMLEMMQKYTVQKLFDAIVNAGKGLPLYSTIVGGVDVVSSLFLLNSMVYAHDKRASDLLHAIISICKNRKFLPDYLDPITGHAIVKDPVSIVAVSLLYQAVRNMCFIDHPERLELFPVPQEEWFNDSQMVLSNVPSRFGMISYSATATSNEFVIQFTSIPRFIPHDILINLPFKAKIKQSDDFLVKYETEKSWCINGWPSEIRFKR